MLAITARCGSPNHRMYDVEPIMNLPTRIRETVERNDTRNRTTTDKRVRVSRTRRYKGVTAPYWRPPGLRRLLVAAAALVVQIGCS
eukprot:1454475-Prymnesium_polylepis.2